MEISPVDSRSSQIGSSQIHEHHKAHRTEQKSAPEETAPAAKKDDAELSDEAHDAEEEHEGKGNINALLNGLKDTDDVDGKDKPGGPDDAEDAQDEDARKADEADQAEEAKEAEEKKKLEEQLKELDNKVLDKMKEYEQALLSGDETKASQLLGEFQDLMKQREDVMQKLGMPTAETDPLGGQQDTGGAAPVGSGGSPSGSGYTSPLYTGGKGPDNNYFDGYNQTHGDNYSAPAPPSGPIPEGKIVPDGSGQDAVNLGKQYLGQNAIDIKGKLPNFTAAGGQTNNCADFVSSCLESTGRLQGHHVGVTDLERSLRSQGYQEVPREQAQPGDVWISSSRGHTEMCSAPGGARCIGSNNDRPGHQVISENTVSGGHWYHLNSKK